MISAKALKRVFREVRAGRKTAPYFRLIGDVMVCARCGSMVTNGAREHHRLWHLKWEGPDEVV